MKNKPTYPSHRSVLDPEITIRLPRMCAREALHVISILAELDAAIWRLHGDGLADELALHGVDTPCPPDAKTLANSDNPRRHALGSAMKASLYWSNLTSHDERMRDTMEYLFSQHPKLLHFVFNPDHPELRAQPEILLQDAQCFSTGEKILIQVALDLWDACGNARISDIIHRLDRHHFVKVLMLMQQCRGEPKDAALLCYRHSEISF